jgi:hypothetical protein
MTILFSAKPPGTNQRRVGAVIKFDKNLRRPKSIRCTIDGENKWIYVDQWDVQLSYPDLLSGLTPGPYVTLPPKMPTPDLVIINLHPDDMTGTEIFCGSGNLSTSCEKNGIKMQRVDRVLDPGPNKWNDDFGKLSSDSLRTLFGVRYVHASPDCRTFSNLQQSLNRRNVENNYLGTTKSASEANGMLLKVFYALVARFRSNNDLLFTLENPYATFHLHPLVRLICLPVDVGGLGATVVTVPFCAFGERVRKPTVFVTNCKTLIHALGTTDKTHEPDAPDPKFCCSLPPLTVHVFSRKDTPLSTQHRDKYVS